MCYKNSSLIFTTLLLPINTFSTTKKDLQNDKLSVLLVHSMGGDFGNTKNVFVHSSHSNNDIWLPSLESKYKSELILPSLNKIIEDEKCLF